LCICKRTDVDDDLPDLFGCVLLVVARHPPIPGVLALINDVEEIAVGKGCEPGRVSPVVKVHVHIFSQKALPVAVLPAAAKADLRPRTSMGEPKDRECKFAKRTGLNYVKSIACLF
jgi:hypothetical protein